MKSFTYALEGIRVCLKEQNFKFHIVAGIIATILGIFTQLTRVEWMVLCIVIGLVLMAEMFNTAIEKVVDLVSPDIHPLAKAAKDISAAAVLVIASVSVIIGILIFIPKWLSLF
ncbi:MAG: diacylglycerol kinase family protein [Lysinibacillus sp.]